MYTMPAAAVMPSFQHKARLDACVLRAGAVQIMQDPGRSRALGKSSTRREPSLASQTHRVNISQLQRGAERWERRYCASATTHPSAGMDPTP